MDETALETNINTLKEMLLDEEKLVTYVSLSKDLCIHVNDSKLLLSKFIEDIKNKSPDTKLHVSYIISGLSEDNRARTTVVPESQITSLRDAFKTLFFEHIYSVSRAHQSVDKVTLLAVNKLEDLPLCTGLIKSSSCTKRTSNEIGNLKAGSQVSVEPGTSNEHKKPSKNGPAESKTVKKVQETKSEPIIKTETTSPKKEVSTDANKKHEPKINVAKSQKGIAGFFNKSNSAPAGKTVKESVEKKPKVEVKIEKEPEPVNDPEIKAEKMEVDIDVEDADETPKKIVKKEKKKEEQRSANKSLNNIKKNAKVDKKRKRVLHVSDSESEDEKNDPFADEPAAKAESEDEIPPTPTVNTVKITSGITNPRKKRKIVDKTYTDEEGYILTKKVEVYESCSENDEEEHAKENIQSQQPIKKEEKSEVSPVKGKKAAAKNSKKKISPPQKGKQSTLMNFFKKV